MYRSLPDLAPSPAPRGRLFSPLSATVNGVKTAVLLGALGGLLLFLGSQFGPGGTMLGLALGIGVIAGSWWFSDRIALAAARAVPADPHRYPGYHRIVQDLCARAGLPMPRLYVTPDRQPNAFATGRDPEHAAVAVTAGLLELMDRDELEGVIAHELAHIGNRDILISSVAAAIATGISYLAHLLLWLPLFGHDDDGPNPIGLVAAALLAPFAAGILQLAVSRSREFEADATGARLVGDGAPLARALAKLDRASRVRPMAVDPPQASKYIVNPLAGRRVAFASLFATHPPVESRIERLTRGTWH